MDRRDRNNTTTYTVLAIYRHWANHFLYITSLEPLTLPSLCVWGKLRLEEKWFPKGTKVHCWNSKLGPASSKYVNHLQFTNVKEWTWLLSERSLTFPYALHFSTLWGNQERVSILYFDGCPSGSSDVGFDQVFPTWGSTSLILAALVCPSTLTGVLLPRNKLRNII